MTGLAGPADIGVIGLGVMGRNLALNMVDRGFTPVGFDEAEAARAASAAQGLSIAPDLKALMRALARPGLVLLMVPAGEPVDAALGALAPNLAPGDVVIDGGNTHWRDTQRRAGAMAGQGLHYLGTGISGGERGARHGPAIMAGGAAAGWARAAAVLEAIAAKVDGAPCCAHLGPGGAGHFVKMVHNGIEYAVMQLLAEAYAVLRRLGGASPAAIADLMHAWRRIGPDSYLLEITEQILRETDAETGQPMLDVIQDEAEQKGTGAWASIAAVELGVPAPTVIEAAQARSLSSLKALRAALAAPAKVGHAGTGPALDPESVRAALVGATVCAYAQGFMLLAEASSAHGFELQLARVAQIWRGGCIIRSQLLEPIAALYRARPTIQTLLEESELRGRLLADSVGLRRVVALAAENRLAVPAHASALAWLDGLTTARLPAELIQAQRDFFGAHRFTRVDRPGRFHHDWGAADG